ncbi:MAG: DMT family transporter, partial [Bacteroidota bacterium]|nr:DMT family transporter [Bacteroidota bacterium]
MPFVGEFSALLTAFLWSGTSIVFTEATTRVGSIQVNITRMIMALVLLLISLLVLGLDLALSSNQIMNLTWSGIVGLVLGDTFLFRAFKDIGARVSMLVMSLVPGFTAIMALLFLGESLSLQAVAGMVVTMTGVGIVVLDRRPPAAGKYHVTAKGLLFALLGAFGQASGLIFAKQAFLEAPIHGLVATTVRIGTAVIIFLPMALLLRWYHNPFKVYARDKTALGYTATGAVLGPYLGITFSFIAIAYTEVAVATT